MRSALIFALLGAAACTGACTGAIGDPVRTSPPVHTSEPTPPTMPMIPTTPEEPPAFVAGPLVLRRMLGREYTASVADLFGPEAAAVALPPPDTAVNGLDAIGASQLAMSDAMVAAYEASAYAIADAAIAHGARAAYAQCTPESASDRACMTDLVTNLGMRAFRRPLEAAELARWVATGTTAGEAYADFDAGVSLVIAGLLQSPFFLYRVELELSAYELATRLAFFLTGSAPDADLLARASRGELGSEEGMRTAARALLETPKARAALAAFYDEVFRLRELSTLPKDMTRYPSFTPSLRAAMREETQRLIEDIVWTRDTDYRELFSAPYTFANAELAAHSGLTAPDPQAGFVKIDLPAESKRGGFLGQSSFLALNSHSVMTSPTLRGKFVREVLLCQAIPAPPPNVNTQIPPDDPNGPKKTMRDRLVAHQQNPACAGCHTLMDGPGLGLENFDAVGAFRSDEDGATIDAHSTIDGAPFEGARELGALVGANPRAAECVVRELFRQATGHVELPQETRAITALTEAFARSGYKLKELMVEMVASEAFRTGTPDGGAR